MIARKAVEKDITDKWCLFAFKDIIYSWSKEYENKTYVNFRYNPTKTFLKDSSIRIKSFASSPDLANYVNGKTNLYRKTYIYVVLGSHNGKKEKISKSIFRHLRNSFAHVRFKITGIYLEAEDQNPQGKLTMRARIVLRDLTELINVLKKSAN